MSLRDLRLRALADAPHMFGTTLAFAKSRSDDDWKSAARRGESAEDWATFVADDRGQLVGMASGTVEEQGVVDLIQMYVEPAARRSRVGTRLGEAIIGWARERGAWRVRLAVNSEDGGAPALYRSLGFIDTGRRESDRFEGREVLAMVMEKALP